MGGKGDDSARLCSDDRILGSVPVALGYNRQLEAAVMNARSRSTQTHSPDDSGVRPRSRMPCTQQGGLRGQLNTSPKDVRVLTPKTCGPGTLDGTGALQTRSRILRYGGYLGFPGGSNITTHPSKREAEETV